VTPTDAPRNDDWPFSAFVGLVALLPRLYVAIAWPREPVWDGHYYDFGARRIAAGLGYSDGVTVWHPWCHWPVGYSGLLAFIYKLFGGGPYTATIANACLGTALVVLVHRFARYELSRARARVAALLCAASPGLVAYCALVMTEPLSALGLVFAGWAIARFLRDRPLFGAAIAGATLGLGTLVHPAMIAWAPLVAVTVFASRKVGESIRRPLRQAAAVGAIATGCALAVVLPWTLRNCRVMDRCAFVSTNGGWNLAIGSFPRATGRFETLHSTDGCAIVTGQVQQDTCWRDLAIRAIRADPVRWIGLMPKKLGYTFDQESFPIEYLHEADPDRWPEPRRTRGRNVLTAAHRTLLTASAFCLTALPALSRPALATRGAIRRLALLVAMAALAVFVWHADSSPFYLLAVALVATAALPVPGGPSKGPVVSWAILSVLTTVVTHAVFFGEDRYHVVITPMLCVLAAAAFRTGERAAPIEAEAKT
jgi:Dolichyl-phosphate-mannose-protein mannosyltransferase